MAKKISLFSFIGLLLLFGSTSVCGCGDNYRPVYKIVAEKITKIFGF